MSLVIGLDFGGTKLAAGLVDLTHGVVLARRTIPTPVAAGAPASLDAMLAMARELMDSAPAPVQGVGVSFGGPVAADGRTVRFSMHVAGWEQMPLAARIEALLGLPAAVANDGDAAALAEFHFGAGRGVQHLLYLTVSTGIGGGIIIGGRLHRGERAWAGEAGHQTLKPDGPPCPCGRNGCLEALASGLSIAREARLRLRGPDGAFSVLATIPPDALTAQHVAEAAAAGDALARAVWDEAMGWLGIGIASAANLLNPGRVVLGGGLTRAGALLFDPVRHVVAQRAMDPELSIVPAALGDDVGILGGAALLHES
ncbi:ROK family protein [Roseiflexus castenholzii]|uniref:ROK family protein n=1 Tax=Roseiflexus castenholzii TaxID=120962 RepID=UPI003C7B7F08